MVAINQFQRHIVQELAITDEYASFVRKRIIMV